MVIFTIVVFNICKMAKKTNRKCSCTSHTPNNSPLLDLRRRQVPSAQVKHWREVGLLTVRGSFICTECVTICEDTSMPPPACECQVFSLCQVCQTVKLNTVIDGVTAGKYTEHDLCNLAYAVGSSQVHEIGRDAKFQSDAYHSISSHDSSSWLQQRNRVVIAFLEGVAGKLKSVMKPKKFLALVMCVELIYFLRFLNFISPLSFRINLIQYFSSASKVVTSLNGACSPSGGYDTVRKWIKKHATPFRIPSPNPDIITFFDNDQVLAKTYKIQLHNKLQVSTITNYLHFQPSHNIPSIQIHPHLSPIVWLDFDLHNIQKNMQLLQTYEGNLEHIFNTAFTNYLHQHITQIHTQLHHSTRSHYHN